MTYQARGLQVSLFLHAVILIVWGMNGSLSFSHKAAIVVDFSINNGSKAKVREILHEIIPRQALTEVSRPVVEREASLDGKIVASVAEAHPSPPAQPISTPHDRDGDPADITFGSAIGPFYHHQVMPVYPRIARKMGIEGKVLLRLTIDEMGKLVNVEVLEDPGYGFAEAAVKAVRRSSYVPAYRAGNPVLTRALLPITFILKN